MKKSVNDILKRVGTMALSLALAVTAVPVEMPRVEASTSSMTADGTQFTNPVIYADVPDVDVIRVGDTYYMSSTTMNYAPGVPIMKSKDLVNWEICNYVYDTLCDNDKMNLANSSEDLANSNGNAYAKGSWASSLRYFKDTYYCCFASYTTGKTYIYKTSDIEKGDWSKSEIDGIYHDVGLYFDEETDKGYLVYGNTPIKIIELNEDYTDVVKGSEQVLIEKLWPELENNPLGEGSHIMKIDGNYYLFIITWPSDLTTEDGEQVKGCRTQLCYTSDNLMGPYERHIILNDEGAAQGQLVDTPDGEWYGLVFQDSGAVGRTPVLLPAVWTTEGAENGIKYPIFGDNKAMVQELEMPLTGETRTTIVDSDEFYNQAEEEAALGQEVIQNGGFESETEGWTGREGAKLSLAYSTVASGELGLKVSERTTTGAGAMQDVTGRVQAGKEYTVSAMVQYRTDESDPQSSSYPDTKRFYMTIDYGNQNIQNMGTVVAKKGEWAQITGTYTIPEGTDVSSVKVFIETPWVSAPDASEDLMTFYVDDVSMTTEGNRFTSEDGSRLKLEWQWNHNPDNENWSLTERPGYLRIRNGRTDASILHTRNTLTQRVFGPKSNAYIKVDAANMKDGDVAGLAALQEKYAYIGIKKEEGKLYLVQCNTPSENGYGIDSWKEEKENARIELDQSEVLLRMAFDCTSTWNQKVSFYYSLDDGKTWSPFGIVSQVSFELSHFVGTRFGLFLYGTSSVGGYADFDYFRVAPGEVQEGSVTVKKASVSENSLEISGEEGTEVEIPVVMEATQGACTSLEAVFSVPEKMEVAGVDFSDENVTGDCTYEATTNSLELRVEGNNVGHKGGVFATIKLRVKDKVAGEKTVQMAADCIRAIGENTEYDVTDTLVNITMLGGSETLTSGSTKTPGRTNPLMDHKFGADPYAITYNGRVYVYMTNDSQQYNLTQKDENGYPVAENGFGNISTINVISSDDMINWVDHGEIPVAGRDSSKDPNGIAKWANNSWAPAACHKVIDGKDKFFLYFADNANGIGVLEADSPIGPFREPATGSRLIYRGMQAAEGVTWLFDPAVLVDDDGTGYLYYGGGIPGDSEEDKNHPMTGRVVKLKDNMVEVDGDAQVIDAPGLFEDSGIHKHDGKYYYTYCSNFSNTLGETGQGNICAMVSDNPMGPFTFQGKVFDNPNTFFGIGGNNHHAFFEFEGENYFVYHAQTVGKALGIPSGKQGYRSTHIDSFSYDEDGNIQPITGTWEGISQLKNLNPYTRVEAETLGWSSGITTAECEQEGSFVKELNMKVTEIRSGDWTAVSQADFEDGAKTFKVKAAGLAGGTLEIRLDSASGTKIGEVTIPAGDGTAWEEYSCSVEGAIGVHDVYFVFQSSVSTRSQLFELDAWEFAKTGGEQPPETDLEEAIRKAQEAQAEAERAKQEAEQAKAEAQNAKEEADAAAQEAKREKELAQEAKAEAEEAKRLAEDAALQAGEESKQAQEAKRLAEEKAAAAEEAMRAAEESQKAAQSAQEKAQEALEQANQKAADAESWANYAQAAWKEAEAERVKAEAERQRAEAEAKAAEAAAKQAEEDRRAAEQALKEAKEAQKRAEEAQKAAEQAREEALKAKEEAQKALNAQENVTVKRVNLKSVKSTSPKSVKVKWAKVKNASGYEIQVAKNGKFKKARTIQVKKSLTIRKIGKLQSASKYKVRMRAYQTVHGKKIYGKYSKAVSVTVK